MTSLLAAGTEWAVKRIRIPGLMLLMGCAFQSHAQSPVGTTPRIFNQSSLRTDSLAKFSILADSLNPDLTRYNRKLDSIKNNLSHRIDSLTRLKLPAGGYTHILDSLQQAGPLKNAAQVESRMRALENRVSQPVASLNASINNVQSQLNEKLSALNKETSLGSVLPGSVSIPGTQNLSSLQAPGINAVLPGTDLNLPPTSIPGGDNPLGNANGIAAAPQQEITKITNGDLGKEVKEITQAGSQVQGYSQDLQKVSQGDLADTKQIPQAMEKKAEGMVDTKGFQQGTTELDKYKTIAGQGNDPEALKKVAVEQVKQQAIDHFAGKEKILESAMSQISKLKQKYSSLNSLKDIPKGIPNAMRGKPFIERVVPGLTLQVQVRDRLNIDFNPLVGYRFTGRITAGIGWNERVAFHRHHHFGFNAHSGSVYGPRTFVEFKLKEGFSVKGEVEKMSAFVPKLALTGPYDPGSRRWIWGVFVGIKKNYQFMRGIRGNCQTLYNLYKVNYNESPYADRIQVRMGFEFPLKKKPLLQAVTQPPMDFRTLTGAVGLKMSDLTGMQKYGGVVLSSFRFGKDVVHVTKGITSRWKTAREVVSTRGSYRFKYNKKIRGDEVRDENDSLVATTRHFYDVTMKGGRYYDFVKVSHTEWKYVSEGKDIVTGKLVNSGPGKEVAIKNLGEAGEDTRLLEAMSRIYGMGLMKMGEKKLIYFHR